MAKLNGYGNLKPYLEAHVELLYPRPKKGIWYFKVKDQIASLTSYYYRDRPPLIKRITSGYYNSYDLNRKHQFLARYPGIQHLEVSYLPDEEPQVLDWVMSNLCEVKEHAQWLHHRWSGNAVIGEPLNAYLWTQEAAKAYEEIALRIKKRNTVTSRKGCGGTCLME